MAYCMVNAEVLNLKQLPITCIYELQLCKTDGGFKVFGHDFQIGTQGSHDFQNLKVILSAVGK